MPQQKTEKIEKNTKISKRRNLRISIGLENYKIFIALFDHPTNI